MRNRLLIAGGMSAAAAAVALCRLEAPPQDALPAPTSELVAAALLAAKPGDALFKDGIGLWGALASRFSENRDGYGHVGVVARAADGALIVIHAGGDPATPEGRVQSTSLEAFLARSRKAALYRPRLDLAQADAALAYAARAAERDAPFDGGFDLAEEDKLYCTELVWRALSAALGQDAIPEKSERAGKVFIALDDLQTSPWLSLAWRYEALD